MKHKRNILVLTYWSIDNALIHTYTVPYLRQILSCHLPGSKIYLLTLSPPGILKNNANQRFIDSLKKENIQVLNFTYFPFGTKMVLNFIFLFPYLVILSWLKRISILHAWCTPGGALAWPIALITGKKLVLDSLEPHAESMVEAGVWKNESFSYKVLFWLEKMQVKHADRIICAAPGMIKHIKDLYGIEKKEELVKPACVNLDMFDPHRYTSDQPLAGLKSVVGVYAGKFGDIYLKQEAFDFFKAAYDHWKGDFTLLLLSNQDDKEIADYCKSSGFPLSHLVQRFVPHAEVPLYLAQADFAFAAIKPLPSKRFCSPIKTGEYWAMGLPVVIPQNISVDSDIIQEENGGVVIREFHMNEYRSAILKLEALMNTPGIKTKIRDIARKHRSFSKSEAIYRLIYATDVVYSDVKE